MGNRLTVETNRACIDPLAVHKRTAYVEDQGRAVNAHA
jgi:hypothetical protein